MHRSLSYRFLLGLMLLGFAAPAVQAQRVTAHVSADTVTVGERFFLTLTATHTGTARPVFPDERAPADPAERLALGDLEVIARAAAGSRTVGRTRIDSVVYEVATFALDTAFVAAIAVPFAADADTFSAATAPFMVPVASLVPPDAADIQDLAPLADFERIIWHLILALLVALVLTALAWQYWRSREPAPAPAVVPAAPRPRASAYEEALDRLRHLDAADLATPDAVKPFYVELSETLRTYLERRIGVPAMEETTGEIVRDLRKQARHGRVAEDIPATVARVLSLADLAKFADVQPPVETGRDALDRTRDTLRTVEARTVPPAALGGIPPGAGPGLAPTNGTRPSALERRLAAPSPASPAAPIEKKKLLSPALVVVGLLALALGWYAGGQVVLPVLGAVLAYGGVLWLASAARRPLAGTVAFHVGLYLWLFVGYMLTPELVALPWLASAEVLAALGGLAWLMYRPGWAPVALLGVLGLAGLATSGLGLWTTPVGSEAHQVFAVHAAFRVGALVTLAVGLRQIGGRGSS